MKETKIHEYIIDIYNTIFKNLCYKEFDLFLSGGASWYDNKKGKRHISYRDQIKNQLNVSNPKRFNILYPEDLFMELLNRKRYDLLTLENILAENSDAILIIPESPGSFAELGAFTNNASTAKKTIICQQEKFKRQRSFITQGPVSYMMRTYSSSVIYFNNDLTEISKQVNKVVSKRVSSYYKGTGIPFKDVDQLTGMITFEILLLYFFESFLIENFYNEITAVYRCCIKNKSKQLDLAYERVLVRSSVKFLFRNEWIEKNNSSYELSQFGIDKANQILNMLTYKKNNYDINGLRLRILSEELMAK